MKNCDKRAGFICKQVKDIGGRTYYRKILKEDLVSIGSKRKIAKLPGPDKDHFGFFLFQKS